MLSKLLLLVQITTILICVKSRSLDFKNDKLVIDIPNIGQLRGSTNESVWTAQTYMQFLGIPYAESPSGNLRFKRPVPKAAWKDIKNVTDFGRRCPTLAYVNSLGPEERNKDLEDCLNLCVYTKNLTAKRPVIFYIHGGGLNDGGAFKIKTGFFMEKDIVMVVPHYRLGQFGFLSTKTNDIPGNMAVLDLILALKWVQKNIEYFGGNPNNITISGQSAGSMLVNALAISPAVPKGLFHRGIMASGSILAAMAYSKTAVETAKEVCYQIGCSGCVTTDGINKCLMEADVAKLLATKTKHITQFGFVLEDFFGILPYHPRILTMFNQHKYPIMASVSKQDGSGMFAAVFYQMDTSNMTLTEVCKYLADTFCGDDIDSSSFNRLMKFVFKPEQMNEKNFTKLIPGLVDFTSIITMKYPTLQFIAMNNNWSGKGENISNYISTFDYRGEFTKFKVPELLKIYPFKTGVHHADEIYMLFNYEILNERDTVAAKSMIDLWTSFAATGKPSVPNGPEILPTTGQTGPYFHINSNVTLGKSFLDEFLVTVNDPDSPYN